jgi:hypothetical protein
LRRKRLKLLFIVLALFIVGGICWFLVGFTINFPPKSPHQKLDEARTLWQMKGSKDYQMDVAFSSFSFIGGYRIIVRDNQVTEIYENTLNILGKKPLESAKQNLEQSNTFAKTISPDLNEYTVDGLFEIADPKLINQPASSLIGWCGINAPSPNITFNSEYGYIQLYDLGNCPKWETGGGLMCPTVSDCNVAMRVRNFEILPAS